MPFKAVRADKTEAGQDVRFVTMDESELMDGDVTVRVTHSAVNYKDGLALSGKSAIIRRFPMVLGIDLAGVVETSAHSGFSPADEVILDGYGLSETHFGGYAERARAKGEWLVKLPAGLTRAEAMAIGTAGYTAMLAVMAIERRGLTPASGPALVTGAAGGVGSTAISLLADRGWKVIASTGRASEGDYLKGLGAAEIIERATLAAPGKPLGKEQWVRRWTASGRPRSPTCSPRPATVAPSPPAATRAGWTCRRRSPRSSCAAFRCSASTASIARCRGASRPGGGWRANSTGASSRR